MVEEKREIHCDVQIFVGFQLGRIHHSLRHTSSLPCLGSGFSPHLLDTMKWMWNRGLIKFRNRKSVKIAQFANLPLVPFARHVDTIQKCVKCCIVPKGGVESGRTNEDNGDSLATTFQGLKSLSAFQAKHLFVRPSAGPSITSIGGGKKPSH